MRKTLTIVCITLGFILIDRMTKAAVLGGMTHSGECISFVFALNSGVAFSMFAFLGEYLKWIQLLLIFGIIWFVVAYKYLWIYPYPIALILAGALSNLFDRFAYGGVVDFIYWHCWFDFAIFNFADILINVGVFLLLILFWQEERKKGA